MTTAGSLIDDTLDFLLGGQDENVNVLAASIDTDDTTLTFTYSLEGIVPGAVICVDVEVMRIVEINQTSKTATVIRAQRGSTAASHDAGVVVQVSPRFSKYSVFRAINDDLAALSGEGLFQIKTVELTYNGSVTGYNLTSVTDVEQIYSVRYEVPGPSKEWPILFPSKWRFERNSNTTDFASGFSLIVNSGLYSGKKILVAYKAPFTRMTATADDVQTIAGLPATANDLPPLGAAIRLMSGHESGRVGYESQPDTRRPEEVPAGTSIGAAQGWERLRRRRIMDELARLSRRYPVRRG